MKFKISSKIYEFYQYQKIGRILNIPTAYSF